MKTLHIEYYALLREQAGVKQQTVQSETRTPAELYSQLAATHGFSLGTEQLRAVVNEEFVNWDRQLNDGDRVVFIPPVAGG
ncbi:MAG: MoaD/ThiS family protein [Chromatiales bacterium]|nr:MoaD/ThiS family protein [Chromatiales bacterium]